VTKGFGVDAVLAALGAGLHDVGENYAAELLAKAEALESDPAAAGGGAGARAVWHFLGAVQRNKVADLAQRVGLWQSVSREAEGARVARFRPGAAVLVQVDATELPRRNGCPPSEVAGLVGRLRDDHGLEVRGLMTVAAPGREGADAAFGMVARLATMVRLGRALFGDRPAAGGQ